MLSIGNTTVATSGARFAYPSGIHEFISGFCSDFVLTLFGFLSSVLVNCAKSCLFRSLFCCCQLISGFRSCFLYIIIPVSCTVYTYCVVQTYRIPSVQLEGFGSSYIGSCCSSSYLYVLVLYLTLRNTPYLLLRYLRKFSYVFLPEQISVSKCYGNKLTWTKQNLINLILQSSIRHFCTTCRKKKLSDFFFAWKHSSGWTGL
jgi:hypothetical protein